MARAKGHGTSSRTRSAASQPCCPDASDLVMLAMANPISEGATSRGLRRIHSDGTTVNNEYVEPYGYVIPNGKCLVVTDLSYYSGFTQPPISGTLTNLTLGIVTVAGSGWRQGVLFVTSPLVSNNHQIGGNVSMKTGLVVGHGHYLSITLPAFGDLVSTELFVYGCLKGLPRLLK
jgi:hypothetical protein